MAFLSKLWNKTTAVFIFFFVLIILSLVLNHPAPLAPRLPAGPGQNNGKAQPSDETTPARQIAKEGIWYLNQQKRPDGFYRLYPSEDKFIKATNMWIALARLSYYQKFSYYPADLAQAEKDAQMMISDCQDKLDTCLATAVPIAFLYQETQKNVYKNFLNQLGSRLLIKSYGEDVMALATQARQLAKIYQIFGNQEYLKTAHKRLGQALLTSQAYQHRYQRGEDEACYIALAQTEIGLAASDPKPLNQARTFFQDQGFDQVPRQMTLIQPCVETAFILGQALKDQNLNNQANQLLEAIVTSQWSGKGGFFQGPDKKQINLTDTAYMIYLLGFEPNRQYLLNQ